MDRPIMVMICSGGGDVASSPYVVLHGRSYLST